MSQVNSSMNFLPEDYVEKRQATRAAILFIGLLLVVVGGILGAWFYKQWQYAPDLEREAKVNAQLEAAAKPIAEAQEIDAERAKMVAKAELTTTLMERVRRSALVKELADLLPKGVTITKLELTSKEVAPPPAVQQAAEEEKAKRAQQGLPPEPQKAPELEVDIDLIGTAATDGQVAQYLAAMGKSPLLADVNLLSSEEGKKGKDENAAIVRQFHVEMQINPTADLRRLGPGDAPVPTSSADN